MSNGFIYIPGLGIYRQDTVKKVVPYAETDYHITVEPPVSSEEDFQFMLTKRTDVFAAIYLEGEEEPIFDEDSKNPVTSQAVLTLEDVMLGLFAADDDDVKEKIRKKTKNYKIRIKKIAEHEVKLLGLEAAKGSANYDSLIKALQDTAPTNEGQAERVSEVSDMLNARLQEIVSESFDSDKEHVFLTQLAGLGGDEEVKNTARFILDDFYNIKILNQSFKDVEHSEEVVVDRYARLKDTPPEKAVDAAFDILSSGTAIQNNPYEEADDDEESVPDEGAESATDEEEGLFNSGESDEEDEEEADEVKP